MKRFSLIAFAACVWLGMFGTQTARALLAPPSLTAAVGYSNLQTEKAGSLFYDHDGTYLDVDAAWSLPLIPVHIGIGLTDSEYYERESSPLTSGGNFYYDYDNDLRSEVDLFAIEPRIGVHLGGEYGLYADPQLGVGLLIDSYWIDQASSFGGNTYINTDHHTGAAFEVRPTIEVGYSWPFISAGVNASYMYARGDFGTLGREAREGRIGAFVKFTF